MKKTQKSKLLKDYENYPLCFQPIEALENNQPGYFYTEPKGLHIYTYFNEPLCVSVFMPWRLVLAATAIHKAAQKKKPKQKKC